MPPELVVLAMPFLGLLAWPCLGYLWWCHKLTPFVGVGVALACDSPRWMGVGASMAIGLWSVLTQGVWWDKMAMRMTTYAMVAQATLEHPILGYGHDVLGFPLLAAQFHTPLPSIHSEWLSLAYHDGWLIVLALGVFLWVLWQTPTTRLGQRCRASLFSAVGMGVLKEVSWIPGFLSFVYGLVALWAWTTYRGART